MKIRRAATKDIPELNDMLMQINLIHHKGRPDIFKSGMTKYNGEELKNLLVDDLRPIFVAVDNCDKAVGYAFCDIQQHINDSNLTDIKTLYLDDLCVNESNRGEHVGTELLNFVFDYAKEIGCYNVTLNVWNINQRAFDFYSKNGMQPMKVYMEKILT